MKYEWYETKKGCLEAGFKLILFFFTWRIINENIMKDTSVAIKMQYKYG